MDANLITEKFEKIGARATIHRPPPNRRRSNAARFVIDIRHDTDGEFFDIQADDDADISILDVQRKDRHLLLMLRLPAERPGLPDVKDKFLCGHDERHWFVAAVPGASVSTVLTAKDALKPDLVRTLERGRKGKRKARHRRRNEIFVRQGEWFFIPASGLIVDDKLILRHEPLRRGRGKPHICEFLYRDGGMTVHVCRQHPNGLTATEYGKLIKRNPEAKAWSWQVMKRDPTVFVRGKVSHSDHATIELDGWHRVAMNTENRVRAGARTQVAFLD